MVNIKDKYQVLYEKKKGQNCFDLLKWGFSKIPVHDLNY